MNRQGTVRVSTRGATKAPRALTAREVRMLRFVANRIDECGFQPSYREICNEYGWKSPNAVAQMIVTLKRLGVVRVGEHHSRAIGFAWKEWVTK